MKTGLQFYRRRLLPLLGILTFTAICTGTALGTAQQPLFDKYKRIVVLDPGHGGREFGARGPEGTLEKTVTLALANLIATELKRDYKVALTRTDDYHIDLDSRTGLANHLKADIFISFHTGGNFVFNTTGTTIFFYQNATDSSSSMEKMPESPDKNTNSPIEWNHIQDSYLKKSRTLARMIHSRLNNMKTIENSRIRGAPLAVLQGANMPAILIEVGYLTNPTEEKNLRDNRYLMNLAEEISKGIAEFLAQSDR